jgi:hypothetical protein
LQRRGIVGKGIQSLIVEDIVTLSKVSTSIKCEKPSKVVLQPANQALDFEYKDGRVFFDIKDFNCYEIMEIY